MGVDGLTGGALLADSRAEFFQQGRRGAVATPDKSSVLTSDASRAGRSADSCDPLRSFGTV